MRTKRGHRHSTAHHTHSSTLLSYTILIRSRCPTSLLTRRSSARGTPYTTCRGEHSRGRRLTLPPRPSSSQPQPPSCPLPAWPHLPAAGRPVVAGRGAGRGGGAQQQQQEEEGGRQRPARGPAAPAGRHVGCPSAASPWRRRRPPIGERRAAGRAGRRREAGCDWAAAAASGLWWRGWDGGAVLGAATQIAENFCLKLLTKYSTAIYIHHQHIPK